MSDTVFVTGGAGFIGSAVTRKLIEDTRHRVVVIDKLTYAGNLDSLREVADSERFRFEQVDIVDGPSLRRLFDTYEPRWVMHLAAESHVDRSIDGPGDFIETNVVGTFRLLSESLRFWSDLDGSARRSFRFLHVSTDEVYGSLGEDGYFHEERRYRPSSPYSASKAGSDHLANAWHHTYGLPVITTNCSNNYGPYQFPEKLVPLMVLNALEGKPLPVYGEGANIRDWLYVDDHAEALLRVMEAGEVGETYCIGGKNEKRNIEVVKAICDIVDDLEPDSAIGPRDRLITFVEDRPGHDYRYAIDPSKIEKELGWVPTESFETGLRKTVAWYLENRWWWERVRSGEYRGQRLGLGAEGVSA